MKILTIVGARPQFVKAAALSAEIIKSPEKYIEVIVHTGQHYDQRMSEVFFNEMGIPEPEYNLKIGGGTHGENTGRMIIELEKVILNEKPTAVVLFGDTDSTLAGSIAASKLHVPIIHIEAGLRSFNRKMPEEINRILTDHVSSLLFTPSKSAAQQLEKEGISSSLIEICGDIMYDATLKFRDLAEHRIDENLRNLVEDNNDYALLTLHRAENVDHKTRLERILTLLAQYESSILFPVHPRTASRLKQFNLELPSNIIRLDPVGYLAMLYLEKRASIIITDSGGVQKEAFFNKVPCITLRDETEWNELVELNTNVVVGDDFVKFKKALLDISQMDESNFESEVYGKGDAASLILNKIYQKFALKE